MKIPAPVRSLVRAGIAVLCLASSGGAFAADVIIDPYYDYRDEVGRGEFSYDESQDIPWIENETEILALPKEEDLSEVSLDDLPDGMRLYIDKRRLTVGEDDRVIRLWIVVRSDAGAENGTYEGYRCESNEFKVYAYATPRRDPPVSKARRPRWQFAKRRPSGNYRRELLQDYFCGIRGTRSADEIRQAVSGEFHRETFMSN